MSPLSFTTFSSSATRSHPVARLHAAILGGSPQVEPLEQLPPTILAMTDAVAQTKTKQPLNCFRGCC
jgi:hypothetical protein